MHTVFNPAQTRRQKKISFLQSCDKIHNYLFLLNFMLPDYFLNILLEQR